MSDGLTDNRSLTEEQIAYNNGQKTTDPFEELKRKGINSKDNSWVKSFTDEQLKALIKGAKGELVHRMKEL